MKILTPSKSALFVVLLDLFIYIYAGYFCKGMSCYTQETYLLEPFFYGSLGVILSLGFLKFFSFPVFNAWVRRILSWYLPLSIVIVGFYDESGGFLAFPEKSQIAFMLGLILFIITLIYAPFMNRRLMKNQIGTPSK